MHKRNNEIIRGNTSFKGRGAAKRCEDYKYARILYL